MPTLPLPVVSQSANISDNNVAGKKKDKKIYNRSFEDPKQLTPYQGTHRSFGFFHCLTCNTEWASANTWANKGQDCFTCLKNTYPYRQMPPIRGSLKNDHNKPHPEGHCEMCKFLKAPCKTKWIIDKKKMEENGGGESGPSGANKSKNKNRSRRRNKKTAAVVNEE